MTKSSSRLVVVSNRVPDVKGGKVLAGGLAVALQEALEEEGGIWFGWSGRVGNDHMTPCEVTEVDNVTYITQDLTRKAYAQYYNGFANRTLWPLFHYRLDLTTFSRENYARYLEVNALFADRLTHYLRDGDVIWVHDYHLIPLGECLRRHGHEQTMGIFLHTPFPAMEVLTAAGDESADVILGHSQGVQVALEFVFHPSRTRYTKDTLAAFKVKTIEA